MFKNSFVVSLKFGSNFFRENGDTVQIPFEQEYSIFLKNLNSRKAVVKVSIDGKDVLDGHSLVVQPNSVLELEGFMDGTFAKNRFKFIKMTRQIEDFRGATPEDGLLRVEFDFEKEQPLTKEIVYVPYYPMPYYYPYYPHWTYSPYTINFGGTTTVFSGIAGSVENTGTYGNSNATYTSNYCSSVIPEDNGITVKGNDANQSFYPTYLGAMENRPAVISLKMVGVSKQIENSRPIFTNEKRICETCGTSNKYKNRFCSSCGTRLSD